jgi:hypothetical protein
LTDEDDLREQLRAEEEAEKKRFAKEREKHHENPLGEEHLRRLIPKETDEQREARQEENRKTSPDFERKNNGFQPGFDPENQKGLSWRVKAQKRVRHYLALGSSYEWVLWKMKREMGLTTPTARKVIDDATEDEPENEPVEGRPKKK